MPAVTPAAEGVGIRQAGLHEGLHLWLGNVGQRRAWACRRGHAIPPGARHILACPLALGVALYACMLSRICFLYGTREQGRSSRNMCRDISSLRLMTLIQGACQRDTPQSGVFMLIIGYLLA